MDNTRDPLNIAHVDGCELASAAFGWPARSWAVFVVVPGRLWAGARAR